MRGEKREERKEKREERKLNKLLIMKFAVAYIFVLIGIFSCTKNNLYNNKFPKGIYSMDRTSVNDCTLPECSSDRVKRYRALDAEGVIYKTNDDRYVIHYGFGIDSGMLLYFCDLPVEYQIDGVSVIFSGKLLDACGIIQPLAVAHDAYLVKIDNIRLR